MALTDATNDLAFDLFARWEDEKAGGNDVPLEQFCASHPEVLPRVLEIARQLSVVSSLFPSSQPLGPPPAAGAVGHPADWVEIGRGASSVVYRGHDPTFNTTVAYKVLHTHGRPLSPADAVRMMKRFEQEARILARLKHDGIVRIFKTFAVGGRPTLEMEYLPGGSLVTHMAAVRGQGAGGIARLLERVALAVGFAHQQGIIHRDLKPSNILLGGDGRPCVSDFGVAKLVRPFDHPRPLPPPAASGDTDPETECLTAFGRQPGTKAYMAPEQLDPAFGQITPATDVWALGVILYELVNDARPFAPQSTGDWHAVVCRGPHPRRHQQSWSRAGRLEAVALKCLSRDPAKRYPTAAALAADLAAAVRPRWRAAALAVTAVAAGVGLAAATPVAIDQFRPPAPGAAAPGPSGEPRATFERDYLAAFRRCEEGKVTQGLSEFAALLNRVPADAPELREAVQASMTGWAGTVATVGGVYTHPERITAVAASPDGRWLAVGDERGEVVVLDAADGRVHKRLRGHRDEVLSAAFSRDGNVLVTGSRDHTARVWAIDQLGEEATRTLPVNAWVFAVALTPDGTHVVTGTAYKEKTGVIFWDVATGKAVNTPSGANLTGFEVDPSGRTLVALWSNSRAEVWDLTSRSSRNFLTEGGKPANVRSAAFSPDGKTIATGGNSLLFWDASTGELKGEESRDEAEVLGFTPDGEGVLVRSGGGVRVWRPAAGCSDPFTTPRPQAPDIWAVAGGHLVGLEGQRTLVLFRWPERAAHSIPVPRGCRAQAVVASDNGSAVAAVTVKDPKGDDDRPTEPDTRLHLWHPKGNRPVGGGRPLPGHAVTALAFDADGGRLAFQPGTDPKRMGVARPVLLLDVAGGDVVAGLPVGDRDVYAVCHVPRWGYWVTAGFDRVLRVFSPDGTAVASAPLPNVAVDLRVNPRGDAVAACCQGGQVVLLELSADEVEVKWERGGGVPAGRGEFTSDGGTLMVYGRGGELRAWAADGSPAAAFGGTRDVTALFPAPGGGWGTTHTGGVARRWPDLAADTPADEWRVNGGDPCVGVDPAGRLLVTAAADGKAQAWSIAARLPVGPPVPHHGPVTRTVWLGPQAVTMSRKSIRVWAPMPQPASPRNRPEPWVASLDGLDENPR